MDHVNPNDTIGTSREESLKKALEQLQNPAKTLAPIQRPDICLAKILFRALVWLLIAVGIYLLTPLISLPKELRFLPAALFLLLVFLFQFKNAIISLVLIYQRYAPEHIRAACAFEPTCSQYMILAVHKYGAFRGLWKGIRRICRCRFPNSGVDYP